MVKILEKKNNPKNKKNINKKVTKINTEFKSQNFIYTKKNKKRYIMWQFNNDLLQGLVSYMFLKN